MADRSIFDTLELEAFKKGITPKTKESIAWFKKKAAIIYNSQPIPRNALMKDPNLTLSNKPKGKGSAKGQQNGGYPQAAPWQDEAS